MDRWMDGTFALSINLPTLVVYTAVSDGLAGHLGGQGRWSADGVEVLNSLSTLIHIYLRTVPVFLYHIYDIS